MNYDWNWSILWEYRGAFVEGTFLTLALSVVSISIGTAFGLLWGLFLSKDEGDFWQEVQWLSFRTMDIVRALPLLVLLLFVNFYLPPLVGLHSAFWISVVALSLNLAAFIADVIRGSVLGVPRPLIDAALAVGMTSRQITRRIIVPEALRSVVPTITLLYLHIVKMSSLASVIAYRELTHVGGQVAVREFRDLETIGVVAIIYIIILYPFVILQRKLEESKWFLRRS